MGILPTCAARGEKVAIVTPFPGLDESSSSFLRVLPLVLLDRRVPLGQVFLRDQVLVLLGDEQAGLLEGVDEGRVQAAAFMSSTIIVLQVFRVRHVGEEQVVRPRLPAVLGDELLPMLLQASRTSGDIGVDLKTVPASSSTHSKPLSQQQCLYFLPLPQGQGALRESFLRGMTFSSLSVLGYGSAPSFSIQRYSARFSPIFRRTW